MCNYNLDLFIASKTSWAPRSPDRTAPSTRIGEYKSVGASKHCSVQHLLTVAFPLEARFRSDEVYTPRRSSQDVLEFCETAHAHDGTRTALTPLLILITNQYLMRDK